MNPQQPESVFATLNHVIELLDNLDNVFTQEERALHQLDYAAIEKLSAIKLDIDANIQATVLSHAEQIQSAPKAQVKVVQDRLAASRERAKASETRLETYMQHIQRIRDRLTGVQGQSYGPRAKNKFIKANVQSVLTDTLG